MRYRLYLLIILFQLLLLSHSEAASFSFDKQNKVYLVSATALGILVPMCGLGYWYNQSLKKPWLDGLFQYFAHRDEESTDKKFSTNPLSNGGPIAGNLTIDQRIGAEHFVLEGHEVLPQRASNSIKAPFALLYVPGLAEDIRSYPYIGRFDPLKNPLQQVSDALELPVATINLPPFGHSAVNEKTRYDLEDAATSVKLAIKYLASRYHIPESHVLLWGWCIGGNAVVKAAEVYKTKGVILDGVPTHARDITLPIPFIEQSFPLLKPYILSYKNFNLEQVVKGLNQTHVWIRHRKDDKVVKQCSSDCLKLHAKSYELTEPKKNPWKKSKKPKKFWMKSLLDPDFEYNTGHYLETPKPYELKRWFSSVSKV